MMKPFTVIFVIILSLVSIDSKAQEDNYSYGRNAVSFAIMGSTPILGFTYERVFNPKWEGELGIGWLSGNIGIKYFPFEMKTSKLLPHIDLNASFSPLYEDCFLCFGGKGYLGYLPVGLSYFGKKGLNLGIDAGPASTFQDPPFLYAGLRIGKRF
ncbi:hypothetical protein [Jiulongibacter sp. NS-SX5]|uniref:hypothetical protein n=1 Tax=Jiulongibacter sp. NS-SX5 TaxID=3463854 RepID=UPI004058357C